MKRVGTLLVLAGLTIGPQFSSAFTNRALASGESKVVDPVQREKFIDAAKELRCPTCTGLSVLESDAEFSVQIKNQVREQVEAGKDKEQIRQYFVERYGPWILREPPKQGFNALAWFLPIGILLLGPVAMWFFVWRHRKVFDTHGVRSTEAIVAEFQAELAAQRAKAGGRS